MLTEGFGHGLMVVNRREGQANKSQQPITGSTQGLRRESLSQMTEKKAMDIYWAYDFLGLIIRDYMHNSGHCLYNALVIKMAHQPTSYLLRVRNSLYCLTEMINDELGQR